MSSSFCSFRLTGGFSGGFTSQSKEIHGNRLLEGFVWNELSGSEGVLGMLGMYIPVTMVVVL